METTHPLSTTAIPVEDKDKQMETSEQTFAQQMCELFGVCMCLCDLLGEDNQAVVDSDIVLEQAARCTHAEQLTPEAAAVLAGMYQFVQQCSGIYGTSYSHQLLLRLDTVKQRLVVATVTDPDHEQAEYWLSIIQAYAHTAHHELEHQLEQAEAYLYHHSNSS